MRFIRLVSVGLMVLAPSPVTWVAWETPGMADARFAEPGAEPFAAIRGDRGGAKEAWLWSTERVLVSGVSIDWLARGGGCTDLAFAAREFARVRVASGIGRGPPSTDDRVESKPILSAIDDILGLRFRVSKSLPSNMPGPADFRGGLTTV